MNCWSTVCRPEGWVGKCTIFTAGITGRWITIRLPCLEHSLHHRHPAQPPSQSLPQALLDKLPIKFPRLQVDYGNWAGEGGHGPGERVDHRGNLASHKSCPSPRQVVIQFYYACAEKALFYLGLRSDGSRYPGDFKWGGCDAKSLAGGTFIGIGAISGHLAVHFAGRTPENFPKTPIKTRRARGLGVCAACVGRAV